MISPKKLIKMAKKWQKLAASKRKRISFRRTTTKAVDEQSCSTSSTTEKGHFVVYTADEQRFVIPLKYLNNNIIRQLFKIAEEEFGLPSSGPITLPCDAVFMEYVVSLIQKHTAKDIETALLTALCTNGYCLPSSYLHQEQSNQHSPICSF
ncbi:Auxin-responsive protein [Melia azedarach]|uniref:Auxin-responsive protein n=1 Tax=Melia azedarach TaxID=155640 RepID=A0ACC1XXP6_MELAZ|nr:Auxin-responsive protein [Melia azedarach]